VNRRMVADGMAWHYARYSKDAGLAAAEREARAARRGLWADKAPTPPWGGGPARRGGEAKRQGCLQARTLHRHLPRRQDNQPRLICTTPA
jgi:hypothetical protein